ncbi:MAG: argininosuccinate lyase [Clostridium sp.]|jgi:argininosuccinate lyase
MKMENLWGSRFEKGMDKLVEEFNASITFDIELYKYDIMGSIAHVTMLASEGLVTSDERDQIVEGLNTIKERIENGELTFTYKDEDIHMAVESELIKDIGDVGRKLHTARSRNDQTVLDTKMYLKDQIVEVFQLLKDFENTIIGKAGENKERIMPGFTHFQHAQPVTIGFHLMAYFQQFKRDIERLVGCYERLDYCPLGACALAGTTLPINRQMTAQLLNFKKVTENAMDTVSDRDFIAEFISFAAICMSHLSRFSGEFIVWNSQEFSFIDIDDSFCTGSSIMPQKKNPDIPELIRGKSGRVYGDLMAILTVIKGVPMAFNKDFQEDKEALFDTVKTLKNCIKIFTNMLSNTSFKYDEIDKQMSKGFLNATDLAESFVNQGIPFRTSHELVGILVKHCEHKNIMLEEIKPAELSVIDKRLKNIVLPDLDNYSCILRRNSYGGTAPVEVERQIKSALEFLNIEIS